MIESASDFLKWAEVFGLTGGGGGGGTVTQVNTGTGLTGGPITGAGTISLAPIADQTFLANTSGGAAPPIATPLSSITSLQAAYNGGNAIDVSGLANPIIFGANQTSSSGPYGVQIFSLRNTQATPTQHWLQFFEANNSAATMVKYGAISTRPLVTTAGSVSGAVALWAAVGSDGGQLELFFYGDGNNVTSSLLKPVLISSSTGTVDSSSILDVVSTVKGSRAMPPMTGAQRDAIVSPAIGLGTFVTDSTPARPYVRTALAWEGIGYLSDITLQNGYDNGNGSITVDNLVNTKPFTVGKDETTIFGSYGVYVSAIRNLESTPSRFWFQFFEANDSASTMVQYGAIACDVRDTTPGAVAGFTAMGSAVPSEGIVVPFLYADGQNSQSGSLYPMLINESGGTVDASSIFDVGSTTKGSRPFPLMTEAQFTAISSKAIGLNAYTTDNNLIKYYDGVAEQTVLTVDNVLAGTNMTVTQNGDGTITLDSAGGGLGAQGNYASFAVHANLTSTSMPSAGTIYPLAVPSAFIDVNSSSFVNELKSISGITTPTTRYTGTATQFFTVNTTVYARGTIASQVDFNFYLMIYRADTSIVQTQYIGRIILQDLIFPYAVPLNGIVQLSTGDAVFVGVSSVSSSASCLVNYMTLEIDTVDASQEVAMVWNTVSGTSASMSPQNGYVTNNAGLVSLTLPVSANVGSLIQVNGYGAGGWSVLQNSGQSIIYEGASTTTGVGGHLDSSNSRACVSLRCVVANTVFQVENTTGSITLV